MNIVRAVQTCNVCPAQWDSWTDTGQYLYLRYRWGRGTVDGYPTSDSDLWTRVPDGSVAKFDTGDGLDGSIDLAEFCHRAGLTIAEGADLT